MQSACLLNSVPLVIAAVAQPSAAALVASNARYLAATRTRAPIRGLSSSSTLTGARDIHTPSPHIKQVLNIQLRLAIVANIHYSALLHFSIHHAVQLCLVRKTSIIYRVKMIVGQSGLTSCSARKGATCMCSYSADMMTCQLADMSGWSKSLVILACTPSTAKILSSWSIQSYMTFMMAMLPKA